MLIFTQVLGLHHWTWYAKVLAWSQNILLFALILNKTMFLRSCLHIKWKATYIPVYMQRWGKKGKMCVSRKIRSVCSLLLAKPTKTQFLLNVKRPPSSLCLLLSNLSLFTLSCFSLFFNTSISAVLLLLFLSNPPCLRLSSFPLCCSFSCSSVEPTYFERWQPVRLCCLSASIHPFREDKIKQLVSRSCHTSFLFYILHVYLRASCAVTCASCVCECVCFMSSLSVLMSF